MFVQCTCTRTLYCQNVKVRGPSWTVKPVRCSWLPDVVYTRDKYTVCAVESMFVYRWGPGCIVWPVSSSWLPAAPYSWWRRGPAQGPTESTKMPIHRRWINTEEKAKFVAAVWGTECYWMYSIPCRSKLFCTRTIWRIPGWFEEKEEFITFFKIVLVQNS